MNGVISDILDKIQKAPALNGGFTNLQREVSEIKEYQVKSVIGMEYLKVTTTETQGKVEEIHQTMYNPTNGLFQRLGSVERDGEDTTKTLDKLEETADKSHTEVQKNEERLRDLEVKTTALTKDFETQVTSLKKVAGDDYSDIKDMVRIKRNVKRVFWAIGLAFFAAFGKAAWDLAVYIQALFSHSAPPGH